MTEQELEGHRYQCLIRELCRMADKRGTNWLRGFVDGWKQWKRLRNDFWREWNAGNRGEYGDWRQPENASDDRNATC